MSAWVLVLCLSWAPLLRTGVTVGVTSIDMPYQQTCQSALHEARSAGTFKDGFCLRRESVGGQQ